VQVESRDVRRERQRPGVERGVEEHPVVRRGLERELKGDRYAWACVAGVLVLEEPGDNGLEGVVQDPEIEVAPVVDACNYGDCLESGEGSGGVEEVVEVYWRCGEVGYVPEEVGGLRAV